MAAEECPHVRSVAHVVRLMRAHRTTAELVIQRRNRQPLRYPGAGGRIGYQSRSQ
jgi:hypothetical protein